MADHDDAVRELSADVLVLGGGPAGVWAAVSAAEAGAAVVLADKGYCGTSGPTASGGNNLWMVPPGPGREAAIEQRAAAAGGLTEHRWMARVLQTTWQRGLDLAGWGYRFPVDDDGRQRRSSLQGPEYLRRMRRRVQRMGVRILDHHPALGLRRAADGSVIGAWGRARQDGDRPWRVHAGATVLATGGCAFLSGSFGTDVDTGEGQLMAVEAGAVLSGMEFSSAYAMAPAWGAHTKGLMMKYAVYYDAEGHPLGLPEGPAGRRAASRLLAQGRPVWARLDRAPTAIHHSMRRSQPNFFLPLDKAGVDPFTQRWPLRLVHEGTVRGTGGLRVRGDWCATDVPGLFAAGDAASRELITGAISGGGSHNGAWAISSGTWAGRGAARYAARLGAAPPAGVSDIPGPGDGSAPVPDDGAVAEVIRDVQRLILPADRTMLRDGARLRSTIDELDELHRTVTAWGSAGRQAVRPRVAAALVAQARWVSVAASGRDETRGMHVRTDRPQTRPGPAARQLVRGVDVVDVADDRPRPALELAS